MTDAASAGGILKMIRKSKKLSRDISQIPHYHYETVSDYSDPKYVGSTSTHHLELIRLIEFNSREGIQVKISIHDKRSPPT